MESGIMAAQQRDICSILHADCVIEGGIEPLLARAHADHVQLEPYRWMERGQIYERDGQAVAYLAQPYTLSTEDLGEIVALCEKHELRVDISMRSEWNPGETLGLLFWRKELNPFIPPHVLDQVT
jgi:hypothetical protein